MKLKQKEKYMSRTFVSFMVGLVFIASSFTRAAESVALAIAPVVDAKSPALSDGKAPPMLADAPGRGYLSHPAIHGDRLVFVADRDLWTTKISGTAPYEAARLTSGAGGESWPVISPDGKTLAFAIPIIAKILNQ